MKLGCKTCGRPFEATRSRRYCSRPCWPSERPFAPTPGEVPETGDLEEVIALLWAAAKRGSVTAAAILLKEAKTAGPTKGPTTTINELADRRKT